MRVDAKGAGLHAAPAGRATDASLGARFARLAPVVRSGLSVARITIPADPLAKA